jgi:hypothetical protein
MSSSIINVGYLDSNTSYQALKWLMLQPISPKFISRFQYSSSDYIFQSLYNEKPLGKASLIKVWPSNASKN